MGAKFAGLVQMFGLADEVEVGRIVHLHYVDEHTKAAMLLGASALIYPSVYEGFGLPVTEAMAVGTPVISSVSTSLPEVLGDEGYYFDPFSLPSLADALLRFEGDLSQGAVQDMKARAQQRAKLFSYDHTYQVVVEGLTECFEEEVACPMDAVERVRFG